jgi:serine/threonine protein kinase
MHIPQIGPYRVLEPLGHGGMGIVFRARHIASERVVALKTVRVPAPKWLDSIRREIHALTRVRHPGVVRIVDHGVHEGRPWYAMDLLEGESLRHLVQRVWSPFRRFSPAVGSTQPAVSATSLNTEAAAEPPAIRIDSSRPQSPFAGLPPAAAGALVQALDLMRRVCATLAYLHGEGFINCDLKPDNILVVDGLPVIIDFGLAAHHPGGSGREALEAQRGMAGTLLYMSPEQIRGEFVDARADLYSVGCILYELVTGRTPFDGPARLLIQQHLTDAPVQPSELVSDLPDQLERLILKLLEKDVRVRSGYADEVAVQLTRLAGERQTLEALPPARSYLYRSRLVGRDALLNDLLRLREAAVSGTGKFVLLSGESGTGKTRLAMELTRVVAASGVLTITSEASAGHSDPTAVRNGPLDTIRPLLRAIADRCQEGGPLVTERLVGHRQSILAKYEPLLAQVPIASTSPTTSALEADGSRQQLFKYVAESLSRFAQEFPILWVLDDVHWADELSTAFLQSLSPAFLQSTRLMLLCTYRSEEPSDGIALLATMPHVEHLHLPRLDNAAMRSMLAEMLALDSPRDDFVQYVTEQAEGNPFFAAEYMRAAVSERLLFRDQSHTWQFLGPCVEAQHGFPAIAIPSSLRQLIERRVRQLSPAAQELVLAAAVLARPFELEVLHEVAGTSADARVSATDELLRRHILEQPELGVARFTHDKVREVVYGRATPEQRAASHARAATTLEALLVQRADASTQWAGLSYHFAAAGQSEGAAKFAKLAADHARDTFANGDAVRLYREACHHTRRILQVSDSLSWRETLLDQHEALGDILVKVTKHGEAREAYREALRLTSEDRLASRSRLHRKMGKSWEGEHQHQEALDNYALARAVLGRDPTRELSELREHWIQAQIEELWVHYWLNRVAEMDAIIANLRPFISQFATPLQRAHFYQSQILLSFRRDRYLVTEQTLAHAKAAVDACREGNEVVGLPAAQLIYGLALLFKNSVAAAESELLPVLELAQRIGDTTLCARCATYLSLGARLQGRSQDVERYTRLASEVAQAGGLLEYIGAARANESWLAWRSGDTGAATAYATEALLAWDQRVFPFRWMALLPMLGVELESGNVDRAIHCAEQLLAPTQQHLPGAAASALSRALEAWAAQQVEAAATELHSALHELEQTGYR